MNPWPWLAGIFILLSGTLAVEHFDLKAKTAELAAATTNLDTAKANQLANGKSAAAWEQEATAANTRAASCQQDKETNRQENAVAVANAQKQADAANAKLAAYNLRLNKAKTGSCAALLATPICTEALPQ